MSNTISERSSKLFEILTGKRQPKARYKIFEYESFLDSFFALMDTSLTVENQRKDKHISNFVKENRTIIEEIRSLRVCRQDFEMIKVIGRGHFGEVYIVREKGTGDVYAMKILKKQATLSNENVAFFKEERDIMAIADSEWVVNLQYAFQDPEYLYLVMEYMPGGDLLTLLSRVKDDLMEEADAKFYLSQIVTAVHAVHCAGYVHRDVKPENILIDRTGHLKLADFGSAARLENGRTILCKLPVGTPEYISPEVLQSMNSGGGLYGAECDWWSVGVVFYEILFGDLPFYGDSVLQLYSSIMNFKKSLEFPEDVSISAAAKSLILGLIEEQKTRFGYKEIAQHDFFASVDWTTLKSIKPPHIPQLKDQLDTSHFDELAPESALKITASPSMANSLPFIGYTFTRNLVSRLENALIKRLNTRNSFHSNEESIDYNDQKTQYVKKNELLTNHIGILQTTISEGEKHIKKLEKDLISYIDETKSLSARIVQINEQLTLEINKNEEYKRLFTESNKNAKEIQELTDTIKSLNNMIEIEKSSVSTLSCENEDMKKVINNLNKDIHLIYKKFADSEEYWKEYEANQKKIIIELKSSKSEIEILLDKTNQDHILKQNALNEEITKLREIITSLENKQSIIDDEYKNNNIKLESDQVKTLNLKIAEITNRYETLQKLYNSRENEIKLKEIELKAAEINQIKFTQSLRNLENKQTEDLLKIKDIEKKNSEYKSEIERLDIINKDLEDNLHKSQYNHTRTINEMINLQEKVLQSQNELSITKKANNERIISLENQIIELNNTKSENISKISQIDNTINVLESRISEKDSENIKLYSEVSRLESMVASQKTSNFNLSQELEFIKFEMKKMESDHESTINELNRENVINREEIFKLQSTYNQQRNLINFLQDSKKGKSKMFNTNKTVNDVSSPPRQGSKKDATIRKTQDSERQLDCERHLNLRLHIEIDALKEEIKKLRSDLKVSSKNSSVFYAYPELEPAVSISSLQEAGEIQKREHSFIATFTRIPVICSACLAPITMSKPIISCKYCFINSHPSCSDFLSGVACCLSENNSTFPFSFAVDYCQINELYPNVSFENSIPDSSIDPSLIKIHKEGLISILDSISNNKLHWVEYQFILTNYNLKIIPDVSHGNKEDLTVTFNIPEISMFKVFPSIQSSTIGLSAVTNLSLIFGLQISPESSRKFYEPLHLEDNLESHDNSSRSLIILSAPTLIEKREWINLFENASSAELMPPVKQFYSVSSSILKGINSVAFLSDNIMLIAHLNGITAFSMSDKNFSECLSNSITCHSLILNGTSLFGIFGDSRYLSFLKYKTKIGKDVSLKSCKFNLINTDYTNIFEFMYYECSQQSNIIYFTTNDHLIGVKFIGEKNTNIFKMRLDESPCVSVNYIGDNLFIIHDKIYVYDDKVQKKKEFLDATDHSLAFLVYGISQDQNYPMNIFEINSFDSSGYLVCYSEYGLFIDKNGRLWSSTILRWESTPLQFIAVNEIICIFYYDSVHFRSFSNIENVSNSPIHKISYISLPRYLCVSSDSSIIVGNLRSDYSVNLYRLPIDSTISRKPSTETIKSDISRNTTFNKSTKKFASIFARKSK